MKCCNEELNIEWIPSDQRVFLHPYMYRGKCEVCGKWNYCGQHVVTKNFDLTNDEKKIMDIFWGSENMQEEKLKDFATDLIAFAKLLDRGYLKISHKETLKPK